MGEEEDKVLLPRDVAALTGVDPKTVTRWANAGKISSFLTVGGQRRFNESVVLAELAEMGALREAS